MKPAYQNTKTCFETVSTRDEVIDMRKDPRYANLGRTLSYVIFFWYNTNLMDEAPDFVQVLVASGLLSTTGS
jgi:hypothetical protein